MLINNYYPLTSAGTVLQTRQTFHTTETQTISTSNTVRLIFMFITEPNLHLVSFSSIFLYCTGLVIIMHILVKLQHISIAFDKQFCIKTKVMVYINYSAENINTL
ncbi:hypothetical protein EB796_019224 [Bugula neritina]|uniref:Uncharacterized protein n=1 Tax=Bugula neritina TaxID=10212 RepID=A0A7J7JA42_BUGNE|nr:hypothetical protein EB796_019224 [Bugula neritina]